MLSRTPSQTQIQECVQDGAPEKYAGNRLARSSIIEYSRSVNTVLDALFVRFGMLALLGHDAKNRFGTRG